MPADRRHLADLPCIVPGCPEPRYVAGSYVKARCRRHEADRVRDRYRARHGGQVRAYRRSWAA